MSNSPFPKFSHALLPSVLFMLVAWGIFYFDLIYKTGLNNYGVHPRDAFGLIGIFTMHFLHGDFYHILSNTTPILILMTMLFYFYNEIAYRVLFSIALFAGAFVWLFGSLDSSGITNHIGASALIYGLAGFLFLSGILRKHTALFGASLLVTFLYGAIVWGVLPVRIQLEMHYTTVENISWEGHMGGFLGGLLMAYIFRNKGIQKQKHSWDYNNDEDIDESNPYWMEGVEETEQQIEEQPEIIKPPEHVFHVNIIYTPKNQDEQK